MILGTNNDHFLSVVFWFDAGVTFGARSNYLGQQSGTFDIAQVQLEQGPSVTRFERRPIQQELALCQRYYQSMNLFVSSVGPYPYTFPVTKRSAPAVSSTAAGFSLTTVTPNVDHFWCTQTTGSVITVTANSEL